MLNFEIQQCNYNDCEERVGKGWEQVRKLAVLLIQIIEGFTKGCPTFGEATCILLLAQQLSHCGDWCCMLIILSFYESNIIISHMKIN